MTSNVAIIFAAKNENNLVTLKRFILVSVMYENIVQSPSTESKADIHAFYISIAICLLSVEELNIVI